MDNTFDRNFLRNKIIPQLEKRWPSINKRFSKVTSLALEASERSEDIAKIDLFNIGNEKYIEEAVKVSGNKIFDQSVKSLLADLEKFALIDPKTLFAVFGMPFISAHS